jgi:hypothetical protein
MDNPGPADRDWEAIEISAESQELSALRRQLVTPLLAVFVV